MTNFGIKIELSHKINIVKRAPAVYVCACAMIKQCDTRKSRSFKNIYMDFDLFCLTSILDKELSYFLKRFFKSFHPLYHVCVNESNKCTKETIVFSVLENVFKRKRIN